jgi:NTE family protein
VSHLERTAAVIAESAAAAELHRWIGAAAIGWAAEQPDGAQERLRATVASRLPRQDWPAQRVLLTATDAETGEPVALDRDSGVSLAGAVAASCAGGIAYRAGGRKFVDGGYRINADNADLASGYERMLVLSPLGGHTRLPIAWGSRRGASSRAGSAGSGG